MGHLGVLDARISCHIPIIELDLNQTRINSTPLHVLGDEGADAMSIPGTPTHSQVAVLITSTQKSWHRHRLQDQPVASCLVLHYTCFEHYSSRNIKWGSLRHQPHLNPTNFKFRNDVWTLEA